MRTHLSMEEMDFFIEGNIPSEKLSRIELHIKDCNECRIKLEVLKQTGKYLSGEETLDGMFTERLVESLNKKKYNRRRSGTRSARKTSPLKPVFAFVTIIAFIGFAFYFGTKYDDFRQRTALQPGVTGTPQITTAPNTTEVLPTATEAPPQKEIVTLTLYFPNSNADAVVPEQRQVEVNKGESLEKIIFNELQKGPEDTGRQSIIPEGSKLISIETKDSVCTLNLSSEFVDNNPGGTAFEAVLINSIVNSLTELPQVKKVQFLINGEAREVYTHAIFNEPFERNESFIRTPDKTSEAIELRIRELGMETLKALKEGDMAKLSGLVHPNKKVRFSPYTYVDIEKDLSFTSDEIKNLLKSDKVYTWGFYDGIGEPINLTFKDYLAKFVYDKDFINADEVGYNRSIGRGNTINNIFEAYPEGKVIEYHFPGFDPQYEGLDWESLKLIFEEKDGNWYLTGIVHDQWTI